MQVISEYSVSFNPLSTLRDSGNPFENESANDLSGLFDRRNSPHTKDICKVSLQCEASCGLSCFVFLEKLFPQ